jgi:hypothetical protein
VGRVAEKWLKDFSYIALIIAGIGGIASTLYLRRRAAKAQREAEEAEEPEPASLG